MKQEITRDEVSKWLRQQAEHELKRALQLSERHIEHVKAISAVSLLMDLAWAIRYEDIGPVEDDV